MLGFQEFSKAFSNREEFEEEIDTLRVRSAEKDVQMKQTELRLHEEQEGLPFCIHSRSSIC